MGWAWPSGPCCITTRLWSPPATRKRIGRSGNCWTSAGVSRQAGPLGIPACPISLLPQLHTWLLLDSANVWLWPALTCRPGQQHALTSEDDHERKTLRQFQKADYDISHILQFQAAVKTFSSSLAIWILFHVTWMRLLDSPCQWPGNSKANLRGL